jgi:hypothetical protein
MQDARAALALRRPGGDRGRRPDTERRRDEQDRRTQLHRIIVVKNR